MNLVLLHAIWFMLHGSCYMLLASSLHVYASCDFIALLCSCGRGLEKNEEDREDKIRRAHRDEIDHHFNYVQFRILIFFRRAVFLSCIESTRRSEV